MDSCIFVHFVGDYKRISASLSFIPRGSPRTCSPTSTHPLGLQKITCLVQENSVKWIRLTQRWLSVENFGLLTQKSSMSIKPSVPKILLFSLAAPIMEPNWPQCDKLWRGSEECVETSRWKCAENLLEQFVRLFRCRPRNYSQSLPTP